MTTPPLPRRLQGLLAVLPAADSVADVAAGHGRLAVHLAARSRRVIATEATDGPYAELRRNLERWQVGDRVEARRGDGLEALAAGEVEGVVIAGLGARRLARIAEKAPGRGLRWVALQCVQHPEELAGWVRAAGWRVAVETVCEQRGRAYATWVLEV
ncbi:MAG TPA: tRNA (adenine(22)-N(1))-methyltransferase TrmK [Candidatus Dormibacteraeota bacterium]|nr:tRNA (adenine(22)-N(1))-methyltransferase TrmK [Candidatus Dormibacteraeota bacterium]